jgi:flavin-binding protein dodecin
VSMRHSYYRLADIHKMLDPPGTSLKSVEELVSELIERHKKAEEALRWIAEYDKRDGHRVDDPSEAKSCIAQNWLDVHAVQRSLT